jgi:hypothetical protein
MARLPGFEDVRPPKPTRTTPAVADAIAKEIVEIINLDEFYFDANECEGLAWALSQAIQTGQPANKWLGIVGRHYRAIWTDGIDEHFYHIAPGIVDEHVQRAIKQWEEKYEAKKGG